MIKIIKTHTVWFFKFFEYTPMYMFDYKRFRVQNLLALRTGDALKVIEYYWKSSYKIHQYMLPRAFVSGVFTSCYDKLGLSRLGFTHPTFRMRGELLLKNAFLVHTESMSMTNFIIFNNFFHKDPAISLTGPF